MHKHSMIASRSKNVVFVVSQFILKMPQL